MNEDDARRNAAALQAKGFDVVAAMSTKRDDWMVKGRHTSGGWTQVGRMPLTWRRALGYALPVARIPFDELKDEYMDHTTADNYQAALYEVLNENHRIMVHEQSGRWGLSDGGGERYWRYEDFPEEWKQALSQRQTDETTKSENPDTCAPEPRPIVVDITMTMRDLGAVVGQLQLDITSLRRAGDMKYADELEQALAVLAANWRA